MPDSLSSAPQSLPPVTDWKEKVLEYQKPSLWRAVWQLTNSIGLYALLWYLAYRSLTVSHWLSLLFATLAAGVLLRVFIIFHDCGHGSFFKSKTANDVVGFITGLLTLTPYHHWRWEHSVHHATSGNLDKRGMGDIWTLTLQEYLNGSRWLRLQYKLARNPIILFVVAPLFVFVVYQRFPDRNANSRERWSVYWMNLAIVGVAVGMSAWMGFQTYLVIQLFITAVASGAGIWMFYVQHQFDDTHWERGEEWDYTAAALRGSSFYKLPKILQWFTGNIGFHHIHHLSSRIPNYNLARCHRELSVMQEVKPITMWSSLKSLSLRLWDEEQKRLVGYREMRTKRRELKKAALAAGLDELRRTHRHGGTGGKA
ncbi:MAG: fatty acid desaturase [Cephaloticoccus sp.]|nr:fatty acid desaturase [Cephaloticoccus sp.]MCF7761025.1 fatty acid desaturase [Cephaloticoccus sp.]